MGNVSVLLKSDIRERIFSVAIQKIGSQTRLAKYLSSKTNRKIIRETIKSWRIGKHIHGWDILLPLDILKELCKIARYDYNTALKNVIKYNPRWADPKNSKYIVRKNKLKLIRKNENTLLDMASILPLTTLESVRSRKCLPLFAEIQKDKIILWSENSWKRSTIIIKRYVKLNSIFFQACSIYFSEGVTKSIGAYNAKISLGNTEPDIINTFIKFLNTVFLQYTPKYRIDINSKKLQFDDEKIKEFWIKNIKIRIIKEKLKIRERKNLYSGLIENNGIFTISIDNTIVKPLLLNTIEASKELALKYKEWSKDFLRGLLICEGCVYCKKDVLKSIQIGQVKGENREFIKRLLKSLDIDFSEGINQISINNWDNFYKIYSYEMFPFNQLTNTNKYAKFLTGFRNCEETKKIQKLRPFKENSFTMKEWQIYYNLKMYNSPQNTLKWFVKNGFLKKKRIEGRVFYEINKNDKTQKIWSL
ncbi:MAG: LAGLIDADG family homing endonuclease [Candidatus Aenigmatarchaeota archaeon]